MKRILRDAEIERHDVKRSIYKAVSRIDQSHRGVSEHRVNEAD